MLYSTFKDTHLRIDPFHSLTASSRPANVDADLADNIYDTIKHGGTVNTKYYPKSFCQGLERPTSINLSLILVWWFRRFT